MDLNSIQLPATLLQELYKSHLVAEESGMDATLKKAAGDTHKKNLPFLGKNQKKICLLVHYADEVYLPEEQLQFLTSILQACKLNLGDVAIVNIGRQQVSFTTLLKDLGCRYLLAFGVEAESIGLDFIAPFTVAIHENCQLLYSASAEQLNNTSTEGKLLKSRLWLCLKQLFAV